MRTVDRYLRYKFTADQIVNLKQLGVVNGIGGKGGYNFDKLLDKIAKIKYFSKYFINNLHYDIGQLAIEHDYDHWRGNTIKGFLKNNYNFCVGLVGILHWTSITARLLLVISVFLGLTLYGRRFYNWNIKRLFIFKK